MDARDPDKIRQMFGGIAHRYDRANTVLSLGLHHRWRRQLVRWSGVRPGHHVLDCATGTGDLALAFQKIAGRKGLVLGTDFCPEMLEEAKRKVKSGAIRFETADAMRLPYGDGAFDTVSMAFGIRNVADPKKALAEMVRVTRPGGAVLVLEFGQPSARLWRGIFSRFSQWVLPSAGGWITGAPDAYDYLRTSSAQFPCGLDFLALWPGGLHLEFRRLTGGVVYLYRAKKSL